MSTSVKLKRRRKKRHLSRKKTVFLRSCARLTCMRRVHAEFMHIALKGKLLIKTNTMDFLLLLLCFAALLRFNNRLLSFFSRRNTHIMWCKLNHITLSCPIKCQPSIITLRWWHSLKYFRSAQFRACANEEWKIQTSRFFAALAADRNTLRESRNKVFMRMIEGILIKVSE